MYVTYDLWQATRGESQALYPKVKRVYIAGHVKDWHVGTFAKRTGKHVHGVKIEYEQSRAGYTRQGYTATRGATRYHVPPTQVRKSAGRFHRSSRYRKRRTTCSSMWGTPPEIPRGAPGRALGWCFISSAPLAEFERNLITERTLAGLDAARTRAEKAGGQNSTPRPQKSQWPENSMLIKQRRLARFVRHSIFRGQRCTGIDTLAGIWRSLSQRLPNRVHSRCVVRT